jgi:hypothetical protein
MVGGGVNSRAEVRKLLFTDGKQTAISVTSVLTKGIAGLISINSGVTNLFIASRFLSVNWFHCS